jgi:hypothetical protein
MLLDTIIVNKVSSQVMLNLMSMIFQDFNPRPVTEVQSASPNHIEAALRDVHMRAPNLQLLIVVLPDVSGHYGTCIFEKTVQLINFVKIKLRAY